MKNYILLLLCFWGLNFNIQADEFDQLNLLANLISEEKCMDTEDAYSKCGELSVNLSEIFENNKIKTNKSAQCIRIYASNVWVAFENGYTFHVADYFGPYGNSRIVTCLDGEMRGLQGIADNGIKKIESTNVKWHKNYFEHFYPAGKVISYPSMQIAEFR